MVNRCTGCLMEISIEPGNYRTGRGRKPSARERVRRRARAETKAEERAVENRSRCVGQLDASRDLARPAKGQSGGRARRGEVASVERAPSCSKPKSMATGMSSRPSLSTGSSWIRAMLPPTRDSKATNRRRIARRVIFRSRAWRWRRTQCRDRTRPRGKKPGGSDARHFSDRMPIRGDQTQSARVSRARIRHASHAPAGVRPTKSQNLSEPVPSLWREGPLRASQRAARAFARTGSARTHARRPRTRRVPPHARAERRARERSTRVD